MSKTICLLFVLVFALSSCAPPTLTLDPQQVDMWVNLDGEEDDYYEELRLSCNGEEVGGIWVRWHSNNPDVATVDRFGQVTSRGVGTAVITARYRGACATCTVEVKRKITSDTPPSVSRE